MVFLGGAVLANLVRINTPMGFLGDVSNISQIADKEDMWVTKQEWEEQGVRALAKLGTS
jgi:hypothetical protein